MRELSRYLFFKQEEREMENKKERENGDQVEKKGKEIEQKKSEREEKEEKRKLCQ